MQSKNPDSIIGYSDQLLRRMDQGIRLLLWKDTKDAKNKKSMPELLPLPSEMYEKQKKKERRKSKVKSGSAKSRMEAYFAKQKNIIASEAEEYGMGSDGNTIPVEKRKRSGVPVFASYADIRRSADKNKEARLEDGSVFHYDDSRWKRKRV